LITRNTTTARHDRSAAARVVTLPPSIAALAYQSLPISPHTMAATRATHLQANQPRDARWHRAAFVTIKRDMHKRQRTRARFAIPSVMPNMAHGSDWLVPIVIRLPPELHNQDK